MTSKDQTARDNREVARLRRLSNEAGIEYLRVKQERWVAAHGEIGREAFNRFSRGLLKVEQGATSGENDLDKVQEDAAAGRMKQVSYDELQALSRGWLSVRRKVALEQSRAGNISEEVMRDLFDAMDAEELALDTRGSFRKE